MKMDYGLTVRAVIIYLTVLIRLLLVGGAVKGGFSFLSLSASYCHGKVHVFVFLVRFLVFSYSVEAIWNKIHEMSLHSGGGQSWLCRRL